MKLVFLGLGLLVGLNADDSTQDYTLQKVEASAERVDSAPESWRSDEVKNYMGSRTVISGKQLKETANQTVDEALQNIPGVQIRDYSGTGVLPKISFRGFGGAGNGHSNTGMILLDGIPIYGGPYSNLELAIFPVTFEAVDRIDVIKGGASVQYGPNTFGGVINIITKDIPEQWQNQISERITFWGKDTGSPFRKNGEPVANNMLFDTYLKTGGMINEHFGIQAQANYVGGQSFRENSNTSVQNYMLDAIYKINAENNIKMYYQYYSYFAKDPGSLSVEDYEIDRFQNKRPNNSDDGVAKRFGVTYTNYFGDIDKVGGNFTFTYFNHDMTRNFTIDSNYNKISAGYDKNPADVSDNVRRFVVNGVEPKVNMTINSGVLKQNIIAGARFLTEDIYGHGYKTTYATGTITDPKPYVLHNNYTALYLSDELSFLDGMFSVTPGLRYELLNYTNEKTDKSKSTTSIYHRIDNQFNPAINIGFKPIKDLLFYANYTRSFIPPQTGDIDGTDTNYVTTFQTAEVGTRYALNDMLSMNVNYFAVFADNYRTGKFATEPISAISQGVELEGYYSPIENLTLHAAYTYTNAAVANNKANKAGVNIKGKELPYVSPHQFVFDGIYTLGKTSFGVSSYFYSPAYTDILNTVAENSSGSAGKLPWYWVWNAQVSRTLWKSGRQSISGSLAMNNIFNMKYYFRGIGTSPVGRQAAPGRSVSVYVSYNF
ncbi:TonB-dependent receptor family protein [Helicobacter cappadocius]|uniref:TonB-dependent siderophore receptor n=1 Tax=Helicobacter cappadocius TaxID=3063998 RepID=A0AA90Q2Z3_9HELI|nr:MULTISPECIES: TonB-dependent siderophore receptor [unclassified Helicobacter]MDO7253264.1 TonB-dependent siderophore receptor [Helicobacter sp. faydin-H75]MDP2539188.1 TonB-dependent siderophore receptor [Helicobacter sp. faydin-H76]